jgi:hypothetical protein
MNGEISKSPFWMETIICRYIFKKMLKSPLKKTLEWRKISVDMFLKKTEHF